MSEKMGDIGIMCFFQSFQDDLKDMPLELFFQIYAKHPSDDFTANESCFLKLDEYHL